MDTDYGDLAFLTGDSQTSDMQHQAAASSGGTSGQSKAVIRLSAGIIAASLLLLWLLGMSFR